jgi:hypothetical protein
MKNTPTPTNPSSYSVNLYAVWLLNGNKNDTDTKILEVVEPFKSESEARAYGEKAVSNQFSKVIDFTVGPAY